MLDTGFDTGPVHDSVPSGLEGVMRYCRYAEINDRGPGSEPHITGFYDKVFSASGARSRGCVGIALDVIPVEQHTDGTVSFLQGLQNLYYRKGRPRCVTDLEQMKASIGSDKTILVLPGRSGQLQARTVGDLLRTHGNLIVYLDKQNSQLRDTLGDLDTVLKDRDLGQLVLPPGLTIDQETEPRYGGNSAIVKVNVGGENDLELPLGSSVALKVSIREGDTVTQAQIQHELHVLRSMVIDGVVDSKSSARPVLWKGDYYPPNTRLPEGVFLEWLSEGEPFESVYAGILKEQSNELRWDRIRTWVPRMLALYKPLVFWALHGDLAIPHFEYGVNMANIVAVPEGGDFPALRLVDFANAQLFEDTPPSITRTRQACDEMAALCGLGLNIITPGWFDKSTPKSSIGRLRKLGVSDRHPIMQLAEYMVDAVDRDTYLQDQYQAGIHAVMYAHQMLQE